MILYDITWLLLPTLLTVFTYRNNSSVMVWSVVTVILLEMDPLHWHEPMHRSAVIYIRYDTPTVGSKVNDREITATGPTLQRKGYVIYRYCKPRAVATVWSVAAILVNFSVVCSLVS